MRRLVVGIDFGGTNIKLGIVDRAGKIMARAKLSTRSCRENREQLINAIIDDVKDVLGKRRFEATDVLGIGIGLPGLVDPGRGIVKFLPNVPGWENVPLQKIFERELKIPTWIENDVNLITLGEWKFGAGKGVRNLLCITLGTGVGGGLILNNAMYRGEGFVAGEVGHMPLNEDGPRCGCGGWGCFERYVGNRYVEAAAAEIFARDPMSLKDVGDLARQGNAQARQIFKDMGTHVGNALVGVVNLLNPTRIIIGGGVSNNYSFMIEAINHAIKTRAMKAPSAMVKVVRAKLGDDAGILGAKVLVEEWSGRN